MGDRKIIVVFGGSGDVGQEIIKNLLLRKCLKDEFDIVSTYHKNKIKCLPNVVQLKYDANTSNKKLLKCLHTQNLSHIFFCVGIAAKNNLVDTSKSEINDLINVNALSFLRLYKSLFETFRKNKTRFIVVSSASVINNRSTYGAYSASKAILESLVRTLINEEKQYGVTFNILQPSMIDSKLARQTASINGYKDFDDYIINGLNNNILKLEQVAKVAVDYALNKEYNKINGAVLNNFGG